MMPHSPTIPATLRPGRYRLAFGVFWPVTWLEFVLAKRWGHDVTLLKIDARCCELDDEHAKEGTERRS